MSAPPIVSVILPAFNRLGHLREAIASVCAQTLPDWELIVADDGSDEITRAYLATLADPRIRTLLLPHSGNPAAARNAALRVARGRYLAFLDSDDSWLERKLELQLAHMAATPARRWSYTRVLRIDARGEAASEQGVRAWRSFQGSIVEELLKIEALIAMPSVMAERGLVEDAQGFDEQQRFCEDYDLWLRLAMRSDVSALDQPLARVRVHGDNYSQDRIAAHAGWVRLYAKMSGLVGTRRLRALCRQREAAAGLDLAASLASSGQRAAAAQAFAASRRRGWISPRWWPRALRVLLAVQRGA